MPRPSRPLIESRALGVLAVGLFVAGLVAPVAFMNGRTEHAAAGTTIIGEAPPATLEPAGRGGRSSGAEDPPARLKKRASRERQAPRRVASGFIWPVGGPWAVTSPFGARGEHGEDFHHGLDIGCAEGQPVRAAFPGRVVFSGDGRAYGKAVLLDHGETWQTLYGHFSALLVQPGDHVEQGQDIGLCGSTGRSTGPHVHLELRHNGYVWDPLTYLPA